MISRFILYVKTIARVRILKGASKKVRMDLPQEIVARIEKKLEDAAKTKVAEIQGQYYETYD